ncbi:MAG: histidinol-phosphatase HisJ family protein [Bacillota bacterium]|nr:histidinol-phosphatase HisJ family protein [Bacillota bacterium]
MYFYDYHVHSNYSSDGSNTIKEVCESAVKSGLNEIAVTDHFEPTSMNQGYEQYTPKTILKDILEARKIYSGRIKIKHGVELGQPHLYPKYSEILLKENPYDFVLASVHKMNNDVDFSELNYHNIDVPLYCMKYLSELKQLAEWNKFDCVGHLDLVKRYGSLYRIKINLMDYKDELEEIFKILIKNGKGIEINTSGLRQAAKSCLPDLNIVSFYRQLGGEIITVGSDSHYAKDAGKGIYEGIEIAKNAGFKYMTVFSQRKPEFIKIDNNKDDFMINKFSKTA